MKRITLLGEDGRTALTLDIDEAKARVLDDRTIETPPPDTWLLDATPQPVDATFLLGLWYEDRFQALESMGVRVVEFKEDGVAVAHPRGVRSPS